jgi:butyryl-CoA dehydrogenase
MPPAANPLVDDRDVTFLLDEVLDLGRLTALPYFGDHDRDTFELVIASARRLARDVLYPAYRVLDEGPPRLVDGRVVVHPRLKGSELDQRSISRCLRSLRQLR